MSVSNNKRLRLPIVLGAASLIALWAAIPLVIALDRDLFGEGLRGLYGRFVAREGWRSVPVLPAGLSYQWLDRPPGMLKIGHALGRSASEFANQLEALPVAWAAGMQVLEVDLWLDGDGRLRCFHGPGDPGNFTARSCTLDRLLRATAARGDYIVLDIKTDFAMASAAVTAVLESDPLARRRVIYQLYRPGDVEIFAKLPHVSDYAGPIVTAYVSRTSLSEVAAGARRAGIKVMALPFERRAALPRQASADLALLVHPVHDCETMAKARAADFDGIYTLATLTCQ